MRVSVAGCPDGTSLADSSGMLLLAALPAVHAEAREPDSWQPTRGYTSLVSASGEAAPALSEGRVDVWLHGDHATLRARYRVGPG